VAKGTERVVAHGKFRRYRASTGQDGDVTRVRTILIVSAVVIVLGVAGVYGYLLFIRDDAPAALDTADLERALIDTTTPSPLPTDVATTTAQDELSAASTSPAGGFDPSGEWTISGDSTLGYRVAEVLGGVDTEGAGRTDQVTGSLTIDGPRATEAAFVVDMASVVSDSERRDNQFRTRIMSTDEFPTATFRLTEPIEFGPVPLEGSAITATATGELTLRGVTRSVTFDVEAQLDGGRIGVLGSIPVLFSDYGIPDPSNGFAVVKDNGLLEFILVFDRA
jgi:polyisoprenoid-binding protein YceI